MRRFWTGVLAVSVLALLACGIMAQRPGGRGGRSSPRWFPLMSTLDADSDGAISAAELENAAVALGKIDANKDGKLTCDEMFGGPGGPGGPGRGGPGGRPGGGPGGRGERPGGVSTSDLEKETLAQDDAEKRILVALDTMREGPRHRNVSYTDGRLLRLLAEAVNAKRVVEIGTSTGDSAVWLALAAESTGGHVYTHEIDKERAEIAEESFKNAGVDDFVTLVLGDAHETVKRYKDPNDPLYVNTAEQQSIDVLFLDADKEGYIDYVDKLMPLIRPGGLIIAHNMNTRQADARFVKAITDNPELETLILLNEGAGVGVTLKKR